MYLVNNHHRHLWWIDATANVYHLSHTLAFSTETNLKTTKTKSMMKMSPRHDDVIKWKHFPRNWPFVRGIHQSPVNFPHKGQWRGALMFSLICVWINDWVNNREAGNLRRHRAHYDVTVMEMLSSFEETQWCICIFYHFLAPRCHRDMTLFLMEENAGDKYHHHHHYHRNRHHHHHYHRRHHHL